MGSAKDSFRLSGLPDTALREAKDRVRAAIVSSGVRFPKRALVVNLAPADLPKKGSDYDLPIAVGILAADRQIPSPQGFVMVGELALDGKIRSGASSLGAAVLGARLGLPCVVARQHAASVARVPGSRVFPVETLAEAVSLLRDGMDLAPATPESSDAGQGDQLDLADVRGQLVAKRALEIAAAGGHHMMFYGPPGGGKTMLARRLPGLLPRLDDHSSIEVALIRASVGMGGSVSHLPPFRAPHHTATRAALVGGGSGLPTPGEISLAHHGVLLLDELAEFPRSHLDALRQPLEEGKVLISRQGFSTDFPARFQLVGASNPCPCGYYGDRRRPCQCTESVRQRYRQRVSGPLFDRFDMAVKVKRVEMSDFRGPRGEATEAVARRVAAARAVQAGRGVLNRDLGGKKLDEFSVSTSESGLLGASLEKGAITARGADRVRRVARTIADLADSEVNEIHIAEALSLRGVW